MRTLDRTLPTLDENLALDEALLLAAEAGDGGEVLRFWEWRMPAVVLGAGGRVADDVDEAACAADGVPLARRSSGGGTVLLGAGSLLYSLVLRYDRDPALGEIRPSYRFILGRVADALAPFQPGIGPAGSSDLAAGGRKFSGNSQQRKRDHLLHHGTLLYGFDLAQIGRYLREPPKQPDYRGRRTHHEFVMNLPAGSAALRDALRRAWGAGEVPAEWPRSAVAELVAAKYGRDDWKRRR
jgi:lipoate-protein ligase A